MKTFVVSLFVFLFVGLSFAHAATLVWNANPPEQQVTNYTVHWGTATGVYTDQADTGPNSWFSLTDLNLAPGIYFAVVTAANVAGTSGFSNEASWEVKGPMTIPSGVIIQLK